GDWIVSLAVYARGVNLYFIYGIALADPHGLLIGSGNQGRVIRAASAALLDRSEVDDLIEAAVAETDTPLPNRGKGYTVIKSVSPNPRRRRPGPARSRGRGLRRVQPPSRRRRGQPLRAQAEEPDQACGHKPSRMLHRQRKARYRGCLTTCALDGGSCDSSRGSLRSQSLHLRWGLAPHRQCSAWCKE